MIELPCTDQAPHGLSGHPDERRELGNRQVLASDAHMGKLAGLLGRKQADSCDCSRQSSDFVIFVLQNEDIKCNRLRCQRAVVAHAPRHAFVHALAHALAHALFFVLGMHLNMQYACVLACSLSSCVNS